MAWKPPLAGILLRRRCREPRRARLFRCPRVHLNALCDPPRSNTVPTILCRAPAVPHLQPLGIAALRWRRAREAGLQLLRWRVPIKLEPAVRLTGADEDQRRFSWTHPRASTSQSILAHQ